MKTRSINSALNSTLLFFFLMIRRPPRSTLFPTRRSSDLAVWGGDVYVEARTVDVHVGRLRKALKDRKSTRLNSSQLYISYAVFCLKKKIVLYPSPRNRIGARPRHVRASCNQGCLHRRLCVFFLTDGAPPKIPLFPFPGALPI